MSGLLILGIDTACACAKAALWEDGHLLAEAYADDQKTHSVKLMPMIDRLFREAERTLRQVALMGVVTGPGSFTGLRIGVATAKALAYSIHAPVVGLNTLDFLAASVSDSADAMICSAVDARNASVYCNAYIEGKALWECKVRSVPELTEKLRTLSEKTGRRVIVTGDGAKKYFTEFTAAPDRELPGVAAVLCKMAAAMQEKAVDCFQLNVNYYRQTQAERMKNGRM
jgi:tRNA threonylcarbamoyladenosine biosynthesis protein TsaB